MLARGCSSQGHRAKRPTHPPAIQLSFLPEPSSQLFVQPIDKTFLAAKASEPRQVCIRRVTRFTPALDGDSSDQAETPATRPTKSLEVVGGGQEGIQAQRRRDRWNNAC